MMSLEKWIDANMSKANTSPPDLTSLESVLASYTNSLKEDEEYVGFLPQPVDRSFQKLIERPERYVNTSTLASYLRVRPQAIDSQLVHPVRMLLRSHLERGDNENEKIQSSEDELAKSLALLFAIPGIARWKGNQPDGGDECDEEEEEQGQNPSPIELVRQVISDHLEQNEKDDDGFADRLLTLIKCADPDAYSLCEPAAPLSDEEWLVRVLKDPSPPARVLMDLRFKLDTLDASALGRVLTVDNSKYLLTSSDWIDRDVVNGMTGSLCLYYRLEDISTDILIAHSSAILLCADDILDCGEYYYQHENYYEFWEGFCKSIARTAFPPNTMQTYLEEELLPRLSDEYDCLVACNLCMLADLCDAKPDFVMPYADRIRETIEARSGGWERLNEEAFWQNGKIPKLRNDLSSDSNLERPAKIARTGD